MAVTLAELAKVEKDTLRAGVMMHLLRYSPVMEGLPFENVSALSMIKTRVKDLPSVAWRKLNEGYTESTGSLEQVPENLKILGGDIDIEKVFMMVTNVIESPAVTQTKMKLQAMAFEWNDTLINGNEETDADEWNGLKYRVSKLASRQTIKTDASSDGTGASMKVMSSATTQHDWIDYLFSASRRVGGVQAWLMNENTLEKFSSILRRQSLFATTQDSFDREITTFLGAPLIDMGLKSDKSTEIITNAETECNDNAGTSVYAVRYGLDEGLVGIQLNAMDAYVVAEELESKPAKRIRVDWVNGIAHLGDYCICRVQGFKMAAS